MEREDLLDTIERLVAGLATAAGQPVNAVRLAYGIPQEVAR